MTEKGRSMVEMLGVLAIVGVLSAGAMAGYSKAMQMHKMNRFTDDFNYFLGHAMSFSVDAAMYTDGSGSMHFSSAASSLGLLNGALKLDDNKIYDAFQNFFIFYYVPSDEYYRVRYTLVQNDQSRALCEQLLKIGQGYSLNLSKMMIRNTDSDSNVSDNSIWGDSSCTSDRICLAKIGVQEMNSACSVCATDACYIYFMWK